ncbi:MULTISPECIES: TRAP transporter large permease subunit [unclassified Mameliella]|uniref:TRAP transporter large permease subunit n=1 Tax=unclassified Mameliella TaxID=2630630 RepID=UPI00273DCA4C|nr:MULTISPECIES: TRAP transporter large permease subunit [unclassified Mameliella]
MSLILVALFLALLAVGAPISVCLGLSSAVVIVMQGLPIAVLSQRFLNALDSLPLLAVPMFILAANLLNATGVTTHLFDLVRMIQPFQEKVFVERAHLSMSSFSISSSEASICPAQ